jgi:hypothetical protein
VCVCVCVPRVGRLVLAVYAAGTLLGFWSLKALKVHVWTETRAAGVSLAWLSLGPALPF